MLDTTTLTPAYPTTAEMPGAAIRYIHARPYQRLDMIETGVVIGWQHHSKGFYVKVQPDNTALMSKWIHEDDVLGYVHASEDWNEDQSSEGEDKTAKSVVESDSTEEAQS